MKERMEINWKEYMARHDMLWKKAPESWEDGAFLGNGLCGALVYMDRDKKCLVLELGRSDVYDNRGPEASGMGAMFDSPRLPIGKMCLSLKGAVTGITMRLDLYHAVLNGSIVTEKGCVKFSALVHAEEMLTIVRTDEEGTEEAAWYFEPAVSQSPRQQYAVSQNEVFRMQKGYQPNPPAVRREENGCFAALQSISEGAGYVTGWKVEPAGRQKTLYLQVSVGDKLEAVYRETVDYITHIENKGTYEELVTSHERWWETYYPSSFLSLPDKRMESFYWAQMYKAASATRSDHPVMDNQGPWLIETPWPGTWWNLNVQLAYSPLYTSNRLSVSESLWRNLEKHMDELILNVAPEYRYDSAGIHTATGSTFRSDVPVPGEQNDPASFTELGNLPWALYDCFLHYRMTMDDDFLKTFLYPALRRSMNYYLHFLFKGEDGKWHLPQTSSPEYRDKCEDCNYDLSLINWGMKTLIWITDRLGIEDSLYEKWKDISENITDYPQDEDGFLIGKNVKYTYSHRHYSHLLMVYPLHLINVENGGRDIIERSLAWWQSMPGDLLGFSCTGAASICASLGDGDRALAYLERLWGMFLMPNTMYKEAGPVIETPLAAAQAVNDMMLQSWGDKVRVFPAVPSAWETAAFADFCAEGGFRVSAVREHGKTGWIRIRSVAGEQPLVLCADFTDISVSSNHISVRKQKEHQWEIKGLEKGEEILIQEAGDEEVVPEIRPCEYSANHGFYYGLPLN